MNDTVSETELNPLENQLFSKITKELKCTVCQNQSIFDSKAAIAVGLRQEIAQQIKNGQSEPSIIEFVVQRYGHEVLFRPPVQWDTTILWGGPILLLIIGCFLVYKIMFNSKHRPITSA